MTTLERSSAALDALLLQRRVEEFFYAEADLLDAWRLDEWLALFTEDGTYVVPSTDDPSADPADSLMLIDDDRARLHWRVERLKSRHAHREYPYSRTRRFITNVRVVSASDQEVVARASFIVYRFRAGNADQFIGRYLHRLIPEGDSFRFQARRAELDMERLSPNGAVSMIL
ncbi:MAG: aromatic-ring-hydroxylating dioxygenase subunit beta [Dehalococcoidia bacterium]